MRLPMRPRLPALSAASLSAATLLAVVVAGGVLSAGKVHAAQEKLCTGTVERHLSELPLAAGDVRSVRIIEKVNIADDFGPEILGVDAWVRLNSCSGWLVMNMTAKCYIRQTYTRGDCRVEGLSNY